MAGIITEYIRKITGFYAPPTIIPFLSYANEEEVVLSGQVLKHKLLHEATKEDSRRKNLKAAAARFLSTPVKHLKLQVHFDGADLIVRTGDDGIFKARMPINRDDYTEGVRSFTVKPADGRQVAVEGKVVFYRKQADHVVVSDIDDTVLVTNAFQILKMAKLFLFKNAKTRLPFEGVANAYSWLSQHQSQKTANPLFYVSSSEWNLYDFIIDFLETNQLPVGPLMLRVYKKGLWDLIWHGKETHNHKAVKILRLLSEFPHEPFILIGDSGQQDIVLYSKVALEHPDRITHIFIRDVTRGKVGKKEKALQAKVLAAGVNMYFIQHSEQIKEIIEREKATS